MEKRLSEVLPGISFAPVSFGASLSDNDPVIKNIVYDSRAVSPGSLFFALPGTHVHGNSFIPAAVKAGAAAVFFQDTIPSETISSIPSELLSRVVFLSVENTRTTMSPVSSAFFDHPSKSLAVIGVTGTEGKSTTVSLIWQLLRSAGKKAGFISTVQYSDGGEAVDNSEHQTTPEAPAVHGLMRRMADNGCEYAVIESSSHGLSLKTSRLADVLFDAAVMMNVTHEHMEFHKTFEQYRSDKANLFRTLTAHSHEKNILGSMRTIPTFAVVNADDPSASYFADAASPVPVYGFHTHSLSADGSCPANIPVFRPEQVESTDSGSDFFLTMPRGVIPGCKMHINLPGEFNVWNATAAVIAVSSILGINISQLTKAVSKLIPVKGRMTSIKKGQPFEVFVDYAHTPSSFSTVLPPIRKRCSGKVISLFGSGGERDIVKRPEQGRIASQYSDIVILTDEDPRGEEPEALLEMIAQGCSRGQPPKKLLRNKELFIIPDRKKAVRKAFELAGPGDIVLLLGKAHENSIIYKNYTMPYDEISEAEKALEEAGYKA